MAQSDTRVLKPEYGTVLFLHLKMLCRVKKHREAALQWGDHSQVDLTSNAHGQKKKSLNHLRVKMKFA